jgi:hypothetical protein
MIYVIISKINYHLTQAAMKPQTPPKPSVIEQVTQLLNNLDPRSRKVILAGLVVVFLLAASTTILLAYSIYEPQISAWLHKSSPTQNISQNTLQNPTQISQILIPTQNLTPAPTPPCVQPSLTLGATSYPIDVVTGTTPGVLPSPGGPAGTAWWLSNTFSPFVFMLTPSTSAPDLQTALQPGDLVVVQWADCSQEQFALTDVRAGSPDAQALLAQASPGIAVIIQPQDNTSEYVIHGQRPELVNPPTPEPTLEFAYQFDITFGETVISTDQQTLQTSLTITNRDANPIPITNNDFSLTAEGQTPLSPLNVQPGLPQEIPPEGSLSLTITFSNPGGHTAVLQILNITLDLYY